MSESKILLLAFAVLSPFKFRGVVIKPPAFIALDDEEKQPYIDAGVIDPEPVEVPTDEEVSAQEAADILAAAEAAAAAADEATSQEVTTEFQGADNAHTASQANDGSSETAAATDQSGDEVAAPGEESLAGEAATDNPGKSKAKGKAK